MLKVVERTTNPEDPEIEHAEVFIEKVEVVTLAHAPQLPGLSTEQSMRVPPHDPTATRSSFLHVCPSQQPAMLLHSQLPRAIVRKMICTGASSNSRPALVLILRLKSKFQPDRRSLVTSSSPALCQLQRRLQAKA